MKHTVGQLLCVIMAGLHLACAGAKPSAEVTVRKPETQARPVSWVYHPLHKAAAGARIELPNGRILEVDQAGARWLLSGDAPVQGSPFGAPEPLVGVRALNGGYAALGQGGTVYLFSEPLGEFTEVRTPPENFERSTMAGEVLVALSEMGDVFRSTDWGRSWHRYAQDQFMVDAVGDDAGGVLAYSVPEQWHVSHDAGQTFQVLDVPSVAPRSLYRSARGVTVVEGLYDSYAFERNHFVSHRIDLTAQREFPLPVYARASHVVSRRAVVGQGQYVALLPAQTSDVSGGARGFELLKGRLDSPLQSQHLDRPSACEKFMVSGTPGNWLVLCQRQAAEVSPPVALYRMSKEGHGLKRDVVTLRGELSRMQISVSAAGQVALAGVCPQDATLAGCSPDGITLLEAGEALSFDLPISGPVGSLAFDARGRLWTAVLRKKDGHVILAGPMTRRQIGRPIPFSDLTSVADLPATESPDAVGLHPGPDGVLTVSVDSGRDVLLSSVDEQGDFISRAELPFAASLVAGAGRFIASLDPKTGTLWSSESGGLTWQQESTPRPLCTETEGRCQPALVCDVAGCLVGDELTRVGWAISSSSASPSLALSPERRTARSKVASLVCTVQSNDPQEMRGLLVVPGARDAGLGQAAWTSVASFPNEASALSLRADLGATTIASVPLLPAVRNPSEYALAVVPQVEGAAAFRFRIPGRLGNQLLATTTLEVAWDNRVEGVLGRKALRGAFSSQELFYSSSQALSKTAKPLLLSVAGEGLYLTLSRGRTFYFEPGSSPAVPVPEISWPKAALIRSGWLSSDPSSPVGSPEWSLVGGKFGGFLKLFSSTVLVRAWSPPGQELRFTPYLMGLVGSPAARLVGGVQIAYRKDRVGFITTFVHPGGSAAHAQYVELGDEVAFEPPMTVPILSDLPSRPRYCSALDRQTTPRVIAESSTGPERGVDVLGLGGSVPPLLTRDATLFGTKQDPCVTAWEAQHAPSSDEKGSYSALVYPDDEQPSWLFFKERNELGEQIVTATVMKCGYDGAL